jgi:hypothetical protein
MNKKVAAIFATIFLSISLTQGSAFGATKSGASCSKAGIKSVASGKTFTCIKSGKKLIWDKGVAVAVSSPTAAPTTATNYATLWEKYNWIKPTTSSSVATAATDKFTSYATTTRSPSTTVKIVSQDGTDPSLLKWVTDGSSLVSKIFSYPKLSTPFVAVLANDKVFAEKAYNDNGYSKDAKSLADYFDKAPASGGPPNTYNNTMIKNNNLLVKDKIGMMQMAGHETFHFLQKSIAGSNSPDGLGIAPQWFWEGPAVFVGLQVANNLSLATYSSEGRAFAVNRSISGPVKSLKLSEVTKNDGSMDPYGIGAIATEFLVANVGMEKFMDIYINLGKKKLFADSFKAATGVDLVDFYTMFEEARATLGVAKS